MTDKALALTMGHIAREARHARGLTQEQVAEKLQVSSEFYSRIERGVAHPSLETLLRMADVLGVTVDALLGLDAARPAFQVASPQDPPAVRRLGEALERLRPSTVRLVRGILSELEQVEAARRRALRAGGEPPAETPDDGVP